MQKRGMRNAIFELYFAASTHLEIVIDIEAQTPKRRGKKNVDVCVCSVKQMDLGF